MADRLGDSDEWGQVLLGGIASAKAGGYPGAARSGGATPLSRPSQPKPLRTGQPASASTVAAVRRMIGKLRAER